MRPIGLLGLVTVMLLGWWWSPPPMEQQSTDWEELGAALFFDPSLSRDHTISCASCHQPELAFTDGRAVSIGIDGQLGNRSSMSLVNLSEVTTGFFWDGSIKTLEEQVLHPITNPKEMGADIDKVLEKLASIPRYKRLFEPQKASESPVDNLGRALASFLRSIKNQDSKFDRVMDGKENFTLSEERGWAIFFDATDYLLHGECSHCHTDPLFTNNQFFNNGITEFSLDNLPDDLGRGGETKIPQQIGLFRTPTLRNIALTAPYMHDGRFQTLEEVIDHYNSGGQKSFNVSPNVRALHLSEEDKKDLIAFLNTLTDRSIKSKGILP